MVKCDTSYTTRTSDISRRKCHKILNRSSSSSSFSTIVTASLSEFTLSEDGTVAEEETESFEVLLVDNNSSDTNKLEIFQERCTRSVPTFHKSNIFIRVGDIKINRNSIVPRFVPLPPPSQISSSPERGKLWIGLDRRKDDNYTNTYSEYAPLVIKALSKYAIELLLNPNMWTTDSKTAKIVRSRQRRLQQGHPPDIIEKHHGTKRDKEIMIWNGCFSHNHHGHEMPAMRSRFIVGMSCVALVELLMDSKRVHTYNKSSLGRRDEIIFCDDLHGSSKEEEFMGTSKITRSESKIPIVAKTLEILCLMHARKLQESDNSGEGYLIVSRSIKEAKKSQHKHDNVIESEILLNANLIKRIDGLKNKCEVISMTHMRCPIVPTFLTNKIQLAAANTFMKDIRALC